MKKHLKLQFLFFAIVLTFASCKKDDAPPADPLIGTWTWSQSFEDGVEYPLEACDLKDTLVVNSNGTLSDTSYYTDNNNNCVIDDMITGTWVNNGNGNYTWTFDGESASLKITFANNTMTIEAVDEDGIKYRDVYTRK